MTVCFDEMSHEPKQHAGLDTRNSRTSNSYRAGTISAKGDDVVLLTSSKHSRYFRKDVHMLKFNRFAGRYRSQEKKVFTEPQMLKFSRPRCLENPLGAISETNSPEQSVLREVSQTEPLPETLAKKASP